MQKTAAWASARPRRPQPRNGSLERLPEGQAPDRARCRGRYARNYVIPTLQHDPITANFLVQKLLVQGIDIQQATKPFTSADGHAYDAGSYVISLAQPKMGLIRNLLDRNFFPDNDWTRDKNGDPIRPYDLSTDNVAEFMGVRVDHVGGPLNVEAKLITEAPLTPGKVAAGSSGYLLSAKLDASYKAVNLLQAKGVAVSRIVKPVDGADPR